MDQLLKTAAVIKGLNMARQDAANSPHDPELEAVMENRMSQLTEREEGIMSILFQIGASCRVEAYVTENKKLFMQNVKAFIKKYKITGPNITFKTTFNEVMRTIKKLEKLDLMTIDEDGLPLWGGKEVKAKTQTLYEARFGK